MPGFMLAGSDPMTGSARLELLVMTDVLRSATMYRSKPAPACDSTLVTTLAPAPHRFLKIVNSKRQTRTPTTKDCFATNSIHQQFVIVDKKGLTNRKGPALSCRACRCGHNVFYLTHDRAAAPLLNGGAGIRIR